MGHNTATQTYDTFTDLRLSLGDTGSSVKVLGGSTINDGLGGMFYYDDFSSDPDDNLNVIKPNPVVSAGRWLRLNTALDTKLNYEQYNLYTDIPPIGSDAIIFVDQDDSPSGDNTESQFFRQNNKLFYIVAVEQ